MNTEKKDIKILISGGGTGGHIFPAISIANALRKINQNIDILFVGAEGRMEMEKIPAAGYNIIGIPVMGLPRKISLKLFIFFIKLVKALIKSGRIIKKFKPDIAVGVGGYASGPALNAAARKKIPYVLQEQNSYPGITNKMLAKKAEKIFVAYENLDKFFPSEKIILTGNPIRQGVINPLLSKEESRDFFNLDSKLPCVLVTGGSLGARTLNLCIFENLEKISEKNIQLIWQTGKDFYQKAHEKVKIINKPGIFVSDFIFDMDKAYNAADIIIARAGAGTISELAVVGKPVILVPSPNVAEDHQTKNAMALAHKNAALIVKDNEADQKLINEIFRLLENKELMNELKSNIKQMGITDAADKIAKNILKIVYDR